MNWTYIWVKNSFRMNQFTWMNWTYMSEGFISDEPIHLNESDLPVEIKTVKSACLPVLISANHLMLILAGFFSAGF